MLVLYFMLLMLEDGKVLVLKNGKELPIDNGFTIEGQFIQFKNRLGQTLQLPAKIVNLDKTREVERRRKARLNSPIVKNVAPGDDVSALYDEVASRGAFGNQKLESKGPEHSDETQKSLKALEDSPLMTSDQMREIHQGTWEIQVAGARNKAKTRRANNQADANADSDYEKERNKEMAKHYRELAKEAGTDIERRKDYHDRAHEYEQKADGKADGGN